MAGFRVERLKTYSLLLVLLGLIVLFSLSSPYFLTWQNISNLLTQNTYFIVAAVGLSFVMIGGGIDLSVGYQMSLVGVVTAMLMVNYSLPVWLSVLTGMLLGTALGAMNGWIVTKVRVFPLIITLATSTVFQGVSYLISQAKTIRRFPASFLLLTKGHIVSIPFDVVLAASIVLAASLVYNKTYFGRFVFALGGNEEAARLAGIKTNQVKIAVYALCGFFVSIATMVMISKSNTTSSAFGPGTEFICLTAAIVGGISFKGGEGRMWGLVTGVFILAALGNGMQLAGWGTYAQYIVKGLILLGAVTFDEYQKGGRKPRRIRNAPCQTAGGSQQGGSADGIQRSDL